MLLNQRKSNLYMMTYMIYWVPFITSVLNDINASVQEGVKDLISISSLSHLYWEFRWLKNERVNAEPMKLSFCCKFDWKLLSSQS